MRIGLVGYGAGGRWFHAPYIDAADGVDLVGVVTRSPERIAELHAERPGMPTYTSLTELLGAGVDAVVVTTPPQTRRDLVLEAIAAGAHVVADKPFATSAESAAELGAAADAAGVRLSVYHQRRADADIVTLKQVLDAGELGPVWRFHSTFDLDERGSLDGGPHGGLLRDLGSHLVDQAVWLFGPAVRVSAELDWVELTEGRTDGGFVVTVEHATGPVSFLSASKLNRLARRTLGVYAEGGSYVATGSDVQTGAIKAGRRPKDDPRGWGYEPEEHWGRLSTALGTRVVPSAQGNHAAYYTAFARAVASGTEVPVPVADGVEVLRILDAARTSALERRTVELAAP